MKTAYTPDNTRTSLLILVSIAVVVVGVLIGFVGLSDKPDVRTIVIGPPGQLAAAGAAAPAASFGFDVSDDATSDDTAGGGSGGVLLDEFGEPFDDAPTGDSDGDASSRSVPAGQIIVVPTSEPTPTPEVAAAVQPTRAGTQSSDPSPATSSVQAAPSMPTTSGTVQGSFFTKGAENEGAIVTQNLITLSFAEDGSGAFQGVLDITYADDTHILLNMSGPLTWAPTNPQVEATLTGAFTLDAAIDTDDVSATDADLSISSLEAGSGSLCTTKCFGFTFPPQ